MANWRDISRPHAIRRLRFAVKFLRSLLVLLLVGSFSIAPRAQIDTADEYAIRAAMLLNLTKFIDWPASKLDAAHPYFLICILGSDPIELDADRYSQNQNAGGRAVQVRHLGSLETADSCHILYVSASERKNVERMLPELMKNGVLTVSERSNATSPNQVVGLPTLDEHVRIDVNLDAAERTGLTISSKLLRLATVTR